MSSFSVHTEIAIIIQAPHPVGAENLSATYANDPNFPPFIGQGLFIPEQGTPSTWEIEDYPVGSPPTKPGLYDKTFQSGDQYLTSHVIGVSNALGDTGTGSDPCLQAAPVIIESLPNLLNGLVDTSAVSFTLTNPLWQKYLSSDFISTHSPIYISRIFNGSVTVIFAGMCTGVSMQDTNTTISARPLTKRLDQRATFSFERQLTAWRPEFKIPIIAARLIPYSVDVKSHPPQVVAPYSTWRQDYAQFLRDFGG